MYGDVSSCYCMHSDDPYSYLPLRPAKVLLRKPWRSESPSILQAEAHTTPPPSRHGATLTWDTTSVIRCEDCDMAWWGIPHTCTTPPWSCISLDQPRRRYIRHLPSSWGHLTPNYPRGHVTPMTIIVTPHSIYPMPICVLAAPTCTCIHATTIQ